MNCQPVATGTLMCNGRPVPLVFCRPHHLMGKLESIILRYNAVECEFAFLTGIGVCVHHAFIDKLVICLPVLI